MLPLLSLALNSIPSGLPSIRPTPSLALRLPAQSPLSSTPPSPNTLCPTLSNLQELGGIYSAAAELWHPHAVRDGNLVGSETQTFERMHGEAWRVEREPASQLHARGCVRATWLCPAMHRGVHACCSPGAACSCAPSRPYPHPLLLQVTGQNPGSSAKTAELVIEALSA